MEIKEALVQLTRLVRDAAIRESDLRTVVAAHQGIISARLQTHPERAKARARAAILAAALAKQNPNDAIGKKMAEIFDQADAGLSSKEP